MADLYQRSTDKLGHSQYPIFHPTHRVEHLIREKTICFVGSFISGHKCVLLMARSLWPTLSLSFTNTISIHCQVSAVSTAPSLTPAFNQTWHNSNGAFVLCGRDNLIHSCRGLLLQPTAAASQSEMRRHVGIPTTHCNHRSLSQYHGKLDEGFGIRALMEMTHLRSI